MNNTEKQRRGDTETQETQETQRKDLLKQSQKVKEIYVVDLHCQEPTKHLRPQLVRQPLFTRHRRSSIFSYQSGIHFMDSELLDSSLRWKDGLRCSLCRTEFGSPSLVVKQRQPLFTIHS